MALELGLHTLITNSGNAYFVQWNLKKINVEIPSKISEPWLYSQEQLLWTLKLLLYCDCSPGSWFTLPSSLRSKTLRRDPRVQNESHMKGSIQQQLQHAQLYCCHKDVQSWKTPVQRWDIVKTELKKERYQHGAWWGFIVEATKSLQLLIHTKNHCIWFTLSSPVFHNNVKFTSRRLSEWHILLFPVEQLHLIQAGNDKIYEQLECFAA